MEIITNNQWRNFLYGYEIPESVISYDFGHLSIEEIQNGFIKYRGRYYHLSEFMLINESETIPKKWTGYFCDSAFSGVLVRISDDGEQYQIATFIS